VARIAQALRSRVARVVATIFIMAVLATGWSIAQTMRVMPNSPFSVQIAAWGRTHGLGVLVTQYELVLDRLHPPKIGGKPDMKLLRELSHAGTNVGSRAPMPTLLSPALPGEGSFRVLRSVNGQASVQEALVRPDTTSSSYLTSVVVMNGQSTRLSLHPGMMDPGNPKAFHSLAHISNRTSSRLLSTFNSGFLVQDSQGGFYLNGTTAGHLRAGAASIVTYKDGHTDIGAWGREVRMTADVVSVRQNLRLIVDGSRPVSNMEAAVASRFGASAAASHRTWRSGLGVTAAGDLVYVMGDALTTNSLAAVLAHAGAVRALQLDINFHSTAYIWYSAGVNGLVKAHKILTPAHGASMYFDNAARDFFAVYAR
jgi:hypothetical protein